MHSETDLEVRLSKLAKARDTKPLGTDADWLDLDAPANTIYLVHAACHGAIQGEVFFHTAAEACTFRDECIAFEETRYSNDAAGKATAEEYEAMRQDFGQRHPWVRFSRGVRFIARSAPIGRPVKAEVQS